MSQLAGARAAAGSQATSGVTAGSPELATVQSPGSMLSEMPYQPWILP